MSALNLPGVETSLRIEWLGYETAPMLVVGLLFLWAFALAMGWAPLLIGPLRRLMRQRISQLDRPVLYALHNAKSGTPSLGGLLFLLNTAFIALLMLWPLPDYIRWMLGGMFAMAVLGFVDDFLVSWSLKTRGLRARQKFAIQILIVSVVAYQLAKLPGLDVLHLPWINEIALAGWAPVLFAVTLLASANAINLTDGLDGLAAGVSAFVLLGYLIIAIWQAQFVLAFFLVIFLGSLLAFLWFNIYPARFFMGDVGALSLGTVIGMAAILTGQIALLPVFALIPVIETISVMLQKAWRWFFHRKLLSIAPLHHHFERNGWPETKVTQRFWLLSCLSMAAGLVLYWVV